MNLSLKHRLSSLRRQAAKFLASPRSASADPELLQHWVEFHRYRVRLSARCLDARASRLLAQLNSESR